ncbi:MULTISPECIES: helix-turn-helix transcriptional regulator [Serratia]|uniref:helix-turn-helix transcriptional regulator n=1 Tax=Serratia TaxID=613 RepID=UPI00217A07E6|nr:MULTISPECIES: AlpA family transcriptional regulator [Serratia]MDN0028516.1 AlpA family transcriptional regulator [Serratia marcescens]CAI0708937.1 Predicted transcriptional regulator [Serratia quinivorans]
MKAAVDKKGLLSMVPMSESKINAMEKAGEFPKRFAMTARTVAWNRDEVEAWLDKWQEENTGKKPDHCPDVRQRKHRPVQERAA